MSKKILIVDDSKSIRQQLKFALEKSGYTVVEANDGDVGLSMLADNSDVSLVISDVNMPNMSGLAMVEEMKKIPSNAELPILMLSTEGAPEMIQQARSLGAKGWLIKPFEPPKLIEAVQRLTGG